VVSHQSPFTGLELISGACVHIHIKLKQMYNVDITFIYIAVSSVSETACGL
jgi:hypothetical protein